MRAPWLSAQIAAATSDIYRRLAWYLVNVGFTQFQDEIQMKRQESRMVPDRATEWSAPRTNLLLSTGSHRVRKYWQGFRHWVS